MDICKLRKHEQLKEITYAWRTFSIEKDPVVNEQRKRKITKNHHGVTMTNMKAICKMRWYKELEKEGDYMGRLMEAEITD